MAKSWAKKFYHSKAWLRCRGSFIAERRLIDGGMCQECGRRLGYIVDHVVELNQENILDPMIALNHKNFRYLCLECHNIKTFRKETYCSFDDEGQPIPPIK